MQKNFSRCPSLKRRPRKPKIASKSALRRWTRWTSFSKMEVSWSFCWWEICVEKETNMCFLFVDCRCCLCKYESSHHPCWDINLSVSLMAYFATRKSTFVETAKRRYTAGKSQSKRTTGNADWRTDEATYWVLPNFGLLLDLVGVIFALSPCISFLLSLYCGRLTLS